jgi:hypothetical protein
MTVIEVLPNQIRKCNRCGAQKPRTTSLFCFAGTQSFGGNLQNEFPQVRQSGGPVMSILRFWPLLILVGAWAISEYVVRHNK